MLKNYSIITIILLYKEEGYKEKYETEISKIKDKVLNKIIIYI